MRTAISIYIAGMFLAFGQEAPVPPIPEEIVLAGESSQDVTFFWEHSPDRAKVLGYLVHVGTNSGEYFRQEWVGNTNQATLTNINTSLAGYFSISSVGTNGVEGEKSLELMETWEAPRPAAFKRLMTVQVIFEAKSGSNWVSVGTTERYVLKTDKDLSLLRCRMITGSIGGLNE